MIKINVLYKLNIQALVGFQPITFRSWSSCPKPPQMSSILSILLLHTITWTLIGSTVEQLLNNKFYVREHRGGFRGGAHPARAPFIFCRDRVLDLVWVPQAKRMHQIGRIEFENYNFSLLLTGHIPLRHPLFPQAPKLYLSLTLSCRSIYPMSSLKVFYHKLDYYNDVHISLEILNVFQPNLAEIWLMHYSVIKR